jgi:DNA (cytosine-5)-methyltransferase 1
MFLVLSRLITHRPGGSQVVIRQVNSGIEMGTVKFILRALTSLGYSCQFGVQEAGQFTVAQRRPRVFFLGVAVGHRLPDFPIPTHVSSQASKMGNPYMRHGDRYAS